jgi:hypothetical protein
MALHGHLLALLVLIALAASAVASDGGNEHHGTSAPLDLVPAAPGASVAERARDDRHRYAYIASVLASRGRGRRLAEAVAPTTAVNIPLSSGAYSGTGQFFARVHVGTPAQQFLLVADTGSDLTWVKCRGPGGDSGFRTADSKTWDPVQCSSHTCKFDVPFSLAKCSGHTSPCIYDYK